MPRPDNYFEAIDSHFLKAIYATPKGAIRLAVLQRDLAPFLRADKPLNLLDIGGGAGHMALWCASLGHRVTLIDRARPLLEAAEQAAIDADLAGSISFICADALESPLPQPAYDGVLCHAVLEWVERAQDLLALLAGALKPQAFLSLMYYNRTALEYTHHVYGNFAYIDAGLKTKKPAKLTPNYPRTIDWTKQQLTGLNLNLHSRSGIRAFFDYMKPKDIENNTLENITAHELALSQRPEFHPVSRYIHDIWTAPKTENKTGSFIS